MAEIRGEVNDDWFKTRRSRLIKLHSGDIPFALTASTTDLYYVSVYPALLKGSKIKITTLDPATARLEGQTTLHSEAEVTTQDSIIHIGLNSPVPILVWTDKAFKILKINVLGSPHITTINIVSHSASAINQIIIQAPSTPNALPHFLVHYQSSGGHWAEVYHIDLATKSVKKAYDLPFFSGSGAFSTSVLDANVYFVRSTESESILVSSASHGILERWPVKSKSQRVPSSQQGISHAVSEVMAIGASKYAVRSALTLPSGDWELVRHGVSLWIRPESLAGVVAAAFAEIPAKEDLAKELLVESHDSVLAAYLHRVKRHARDLKHFPEWAKHIPRRALGSFRGGRSESQDLTLRRDGFGFRKIIIVATEKGRVIALDAAMQGRILWNTEVVKLPQGEKWKVNSIKVEDDLALVTSPKAEFRVIETMTGKIQQHQNMYEVTRAESLIAVPNDAGGRSAVAILEDGTPGKPGSGKLSNTTIVTRRPDGSITGWILLDGKEPALAWSFSPPTGETISSMTTRPSHDPVASIGKALGDRNVLYKYLSPNLILLTTTNSVKYTLTVYLLDTITGAILYTTTHDSVSSTTSTITTFAENYFVYTFFTDPSLSFSNDSSLPPKGYQLILSELYESPLRNDRGPLGSSPSFSSFGLHPPHVISTAYVIPEPINYLTTTSTLQGITPRALLAVLASSILAIPVPYLSPRRPIGRDPTAAEAEEGLFKYNPALEFNPQWSISHRRELLGIKEVVSEASGMESTSLVVAFGALDVFGTRVSPIGGFDVLGKGFSKLQLIGTVVALAIGTAVLAPMVSSTPFP